MRHVTTADRVPASPTQSGIWITELAGRAGTAYHMPMAVHLDGRLDIVGLVHACFKAISRHAVLASAFELDNDGLYLVPGAVRPSVDIVDLSAEPADTLADLVRQETLQRFDLRQGPLCRFTIVKLAPQRTVLLIVAHHAVFDGTSKELLLGEIAAAYSGTGGAPLSHDLFLSHALTEHDRLGRRLPEARAYWRARWCEPREPILPGRTPAPRAERAGGSVDLDLDEALRERTRAAARSLGVTHFEFLLGAWALLLHRYGNRETVVGVDVGNRTAGTRQAVGPFVTELAVPFSYRPGISFAALVRALRADLREMYLFRDVPVARAVGGIPPSLSLAPVSVSYRRCGAPPVFDGVSAQIDWTMSNHAARNTLHLQIVEGPAHLSANLQFPLHGFRAGAVEKIARHFTGLLEGVAGDPWAPLSAAPVPEGLLPPPRIPAGAGPPDADSVVSLVETQAGQSPDAVAVVDDDEKITYRRLRERMNHYCGTLRAEGVGIGSLVAVALEPSADRLAWLLAILKAGGAYLPLDPGYPTERLAFMLADSGATLLLTDGRGAERLADVAPRVKRVDDGTDQDPRPSEAGLADDVLASQQAYVIYTSGSTGRPKGVVVEHHSLTSFLHAVREPLAAGSGDVWLSATRLSFDISVLELYLPLITGGRVVVAGASIIDDSAALLELIRSQGVNRVQATPSRWRQLLEQGLDEPSVSAITGGEPLPPVLARQLRGRLARLINLYGPTEATVWATWWEVPPDPGAVVIGTPLAGTTAYVLDDGLDPVLDGAPGELFLGGAQVARGYLGRPDLTARQFVPDPFRADGARLYRTGDRVRRLADGSLEFLGRVDDQVKIRGHRIELGEVEFALADHPRVKAAVAAAHDDRLVAYLVADNPPSSAELRGHLARTLPAYMIPDLFRTIDRLPLTPNGKVDRGGLPAPWPGEHEQRQPSRPEGLIGAIHAIWSEVLGTDEIGPHDDLFDLGGHSLTITRLQARIRDRLGVDVPLYAFYDDPTIAGLAAAIASPGDGV